MHTQGCKMNQTISPRIFLSSQDIFQVIKYFKPQLRATADNTKNEIQYIIIPA